MGNCVGGKGKKDPTILTEEEIKLLLENTKLNRAQINALHQNFLKECPSGKLTKKDFVKLFKEVHPSENKKEKADKFCEYVFKVIDRDSLGYISFNDFVLCFSLTSYGDFKQKCEFAFRLYDLDKDNKITKKEMTRVLTALYDLSGITDRKKDKAPAKKVDEIMKLINTKTDEKAPEAPAPVDGKKSKKAKKQKPRDFINKDQFIDACSNDEALKKLFVDSIFAAASAEPSELEAAVNAQASTSFTAPDFSVKTDNVNLNSVDLNSFALDAPAFEVTTSSKVECVEFTSIDAPAVEVETPAVEVSAEAPSFNVEVPDVAAELEAVMESVSETVAEVSAPEVNLKVEAPEVNLSLEAPSVEVKSN
jgi:Ca2+-binding EF-hand superfamily protein